MRDVEVVEVVQHSQPNHFLGLRKENEPETAKEVIM